MAEDSEDFRPSRVILAEIKLNNAEVARLNALVRFWSKSDFLIAPVFNTDIM